MTNFSRRKPIIDDTFISVNKKKNKEINSRY